MGESEWVKRVMKGNNGLRQAGTRQGLTGGSAGEVIIYTYYIHTKRRGLSTSLYSYFDVILQLMLRLLWYFLLLLLLLLLLLR